MLNKTKKILKNIRKTIPVKIRSISLSLVLFMMGRGLGTDTYFSIYIKEIIGSARGVTAIGSFLAFVKLLFVVPIGRMNDRLNVKYILLVGKILYVVCGLLFFLAGIFHSRIFLVIATILNGIANSTTFTTYRSYYAKKTTKTDNAQISGIYFSALYITEVIGSLIAAVLVKYLELPYMYFFVVIFALVSLIQDEKIKTVISKHYKTWTKFYKKEEEESKNAIKKQSNLDYNQEFFGKNGFLRSFINGCLSTESWKEIWHILHKYNGKMYVALGSFMLTNFLNYISFLFIPIVATENHLNLSQVALVFAAMKLPYIVNIFAGKFGDKYSKKLLISIILVLMSFLYILLGFHEGFFTILLLTFLISLGIAMLFPLTTALVISYTHPKDNGAMIGVQDFVGRIGDILGCLGFGILTAIIGLQEGFIIVGLCTFGLGVYLMVKKIISYHRKNNEREKTESDKVYELPVPVVDAISDMDGKHS